MCHVSSFIFPNFDGFMKTYILFAIEIKTSEIMTTVIINETSPHAKNLVNYIHILPFAEVREENKKSFTQASTECNAVTVDEFFDELDERIKRRFNA